MKTYLNILFVLIATLIYGCGDKNEFSEQSKALWWDCHGTGASLEPSVDSGLSFRLEAAYSFRSKIMNGTISFEQLNEDDPITAIEFYGADELLHSVELRSKYTKGDVQNFSFYIDEQQIMNIKDDCYVLIKTNNYTDGAALGKLSSTELDENTPTKVKKIAWNGDIDRFISGSNGDKIMLSVSVYPEYATNKTLKWEIEDESVATISQEGELNLLKSGGMTNLKVSTTDGSELELNVRVVVDFTPVSTITFHDDIITVVKGNTYELPELTYNPENPSLKEVDWIIENEQVVGFDAETRTITAKAEGVTTLKAIAKDGFGAEATTTIVVVDEIPEPFYIGSDAYSAGDKIYIEDSKDNIMQDEYPKQVGSIKNGAYMYYGRNPISLMAYRYITLRAAANNSAGGTVNVHLDGKDGPVIASIEVTPTRDDNQWTTFADFTAKLNLNGLDLQQEHTLYLSFTTKGNCCNLHYIKLSVENVEQ